MNSSETIDNMLDGVEELMNGASVSLKPIEERPETVSVNPTEDVSNVQTLFQPQQSEPTRVEVPTVAEVSRPNTNSDDLDSIFNSLKNDIAGANNFMATLSEKEKKANLNEAYLAEQKEKIEKDRADLDKYISEQKDLIRLSKEKLEEYEKNQKIRLDSEDAQFKSEVEATRNELALQEQAVKNEQEKLDSDRQQFVKYKEAEQEMLKVSNSKLQTDKQQFEKYKEVEEEKIKLAKQENEKTKEQLDLEYEKSLNILKNRENELEEQKLQFEKYKEVEKKKLELESKNLSQSCARFKEMVSQFNSGFKQIPRDE